MTQFDVIILGGGPAGMSALLWCQSLGLKGLLLEPAPELGGQMRVMFHQIFDYPGLPGLTGAEMRDHFQSHLDQLRLAYRTGCKIEQADLISLRVHCDGEWLKAHALILGTGARKRRLGIPGEDRFEIAGVSFSGTRDHSLYAGKTVCVIGGGDSAVENANILSRICPQVHLIHQSDRFRARQAWFEEAKQAPNIIFHPFTRVLAIEGTDRVERILLEDLKSNQNRELAVEGVFIKVGITPNTEMFRGQIDLDEAGYIKTNESQATSLEGVFAAGDVCRPLCLSVATAVGHGAIAVKAIKKILG
jgi:thioredoxin reductase (NADPH)